DGGPPGPERTPSPPAHRGRSNPKPSPLHPDRGARRSPFLGRLEILNLNGKANVDNSLHAIPRECACYPFMWVVGVWRGGVFLTVSGGVAGQLVDRGAGGGAHGTTAG